MNVTAMLTNCGVPTGACVSFVVGGGVVVGHTL